MPKTTVLHEGVVRPSFVAELDAFRAPTPQATSFYLDVDPKKWGGEKAARIAVKDAAAQQRERVEGMNLGHAVRHALRRDLALAEELADHAIGERHTLAVACFLASESGYGRAVRLPWPVRTRAFFEDRFVLWPLRQVLDQQDRYAVVLSNKDEARLFLFVLERIEEVADVEDNVPGHIRFPDPIRVRHYENKRSEYAHRHFEKTAEAAFRLFQREPFEHLVIGGLGETLPQFEGHLHRYLRDRVVDRWDVAVRLPLQEVEERARQIEGKVLTRQAEIIWNAIRDNRVERGSIGADELFASLWRRRLQSMLLEPNQVRPGFRCSDCGRLNPSVAPCVECGGQMKAVADLADEAVRDALEQSVQVRYWKDPALHEVGSFAGLRRF